MRAKQCRMISFGSDKNDGSGGGDVRFVFLLFHGGSTSEFIAVEAVRLL